MKAYPDPDRPGTAPMDATLNSASDWTLLYQGTARGEEIIHSAQEARFSQNGR